MKWIALVCLYSVCLAGESGLCEKAVAFARIGPQGNRIRIEGQVLHNDGKRPAAGILVYVYQTDSDGKYHVDSGGRPRLRAWMRTGPDGRYSLETIRPGPYGDGQTAAHVHFQFWGRGVPVQYSDDVFFDDDPLVTPGLRAEAQRQGRMGNVVRLQRARGMQSAERNFRLKRVADRMEESILHGVKACE